MKTKFKAMLLLSTAIASQCLGQTLLDPVIQAAKSGNMEVLRGEVEKGRIDVQDPHGWTAVMHAAGAGNSDAVRFLISKGANLSLTSTNGAAPIHVATASNRADLVRMVLAARVDVESRTYHGATPLFIAAAMGCFESARALVEAKADVNALGTTNRMRQVQNVLMAAGTADHTNLLALLLDSGADCNRRTPDGNTAFRQVAKFPQTAALEMLIRRGADVNSRGPYGHTALMFAAFNGHMDNVKLLIGAGADVEATAVEPQNARDIRRIGGDYVFDAELFARQQRHPEIAELIATAKSRRRVPGK